MGKRQIEKDFARLYVGQNQKLLVENYYKKKKKDMLLLFLSGSLLTALFLYQVFQQGKLAEGSTIERNSYGKGAKEMELKVQREREEWQTITVTVGEKEYSEEEINAYFNRLEEILPEMILGENESVDRVSKDLILPQEVEGYPLFLSWKSSNSSIIDSQGKVRREDSRGMESAPEELSTIGEIVELTVTMEYGEWKREHHFFVQVVEKEEAEEHSFLQTLSQKIQIKEKESRGEEIFQLPLSEEGKELSWRYPMNKGAFLPVLLFPVILAVIWKEKDKEIHRQAEGRDRHLQARYPEFVSKLTLLMEAGMTVKGALYRILKDYRQKSKRDREPQFLYQELNYICHRMENGMGEIEAYELFGKRCGLPLYRKLSTLLIQNVQRGAANLPDTLRQESWRANEEQKNQIKRKGEEAGTKLLFPMMLMLGMVMILIIVPACFSFQL
ncbi:MAG: type II secretion system F family protein [Lachnospiraceae bacterium]